MKTLRLAVIEDDKFANDQFRDWMQRAAPGAIVDQWFNRKEAVAAVASTDYDLITLDIELGLERGAGFSVIHEATRRHDVPIIVISGLPPEFHRVAMKALSAWEYFQKPIAEHDFMQSIISILERSPPQQMKSPTDEHDDLRLDPLRDTKAWWQGQRLNLSINEQRILYAIFTSKDRQDSTATYNELYAVVPTGKNKDNIKKVVSQIKAAFRDIDPEFNRIAVDPMRGYRWVKR